MRTVALVSEKGGSGKSTLAGHLAVQAQADGAGKVVIVDVDPRGSLANWHRARERETPEFKPLHAQQLEEELAALDRQGVDMVFVDSPPALTGEIELAVSIADLVVIPVGPSPHDLYALGPTVDLVEDLGGKYVFVISGALPEAAINEETTIALCQFGTVSPVVVYRRDDYAVSMIDGLTVMEHDKDSPSAEEIRELWAYLSKRLGRVEQPEAEDKDENNRRYPRWTMEQRVAVIRGGKTMMCRLANISAGGALVDVGDFVKDGEDVILDFESLGQLQAKVKHVSGGKAGLEFVDEARTRWALVKQLVSIVESSRDTDLAET